MTEELLAVIWAVEATVALHPELDGLLSRVTASGIFHAGDLPRPAEEERKPPKP